MAETDAFSSLKPGSLLDSFIPTGLLQDVAFTPNCLLQENTSILNGLNGLPSSPPLMADKAELNTNHDVHPSTLLDTDLSRSDPLLHSFTQPGLLQEAAFEPNGLLQEALFRPNGLLPSSSQPAHTAELDKNGDVHTLALDSEEDLPDISVILKPYSRAKAGPSDSSSAGSSAQAHRGPIRISTFDGKTIYLRRKTKVNSLLTTRGTSSTQKTAALLDVPLHRLMDELSSTAAARLAHPTPQPEPVRHPSTSSGKQASELWVDRYRPKRFTDLLGDERVHRETMAWVKEWDWCVFGRKKGKKRARDLDETLSEQDEYHRPAEKILLLSGPPGLGKTTLAHVVAQQAGYSVFEVNASDARSGAVVDDRIRPALESGSAIGSSKPVLVVVDEIDGATGGGDNTGGFVQKLLHLILEKPRKKARRGEKRDAQAKRPILRPIICICNDLYASSLTKLRQHARIIRFTRPADVYIVKRLRDICDDQGLRTDSRALTTLVGIGQGDLRACLNTLQFIKTNNLDVTETVIRGATSGMKEGDTSFINVLNNLFAPLPKKRVKERGMTEDDETKYVDRLSRELDSSDAHDRVALGCFEHYGNLRQHDASMSRHEKATEWLVTFDVLSATIRSQNQFGLWPYQAYMIVPFYPLFHERGATKVERPKADWDNHVKTKTNEEIYKSLSRCLQSACGRISGDYRHLISDQILQLELAPFLNRIISPPLRPVNNQVSRPEERSVLARLVNIMMSLDLRFFQEKAEDDQLVYRLDPPIDVFVTYDGKRASDIGISRYAVRHAVAAEIERQVTVQEKGKNRGSYLAAKVTGHLAADGDDEMNIEHIDDKVERREVKRTNIRMEMPNGGKVDIADMPPTDFFGRLIVTPADGPMKNGVRQPPVKKFRVTYRFKEGNSAAVRKPVKMNAFL